FRLSFETLPLAVSVIWVPPWRSRPRAGFQVPISATSPKATARPTKNTVTVRPGRALVRAICLLLLRLGGRVGLELCSFVPRDGRHDLADRTTYDVEGDALGNLEVHGLVVQRTDVPDDPRGQHDFIPDGDGPLHPGHRLLPTLLRPDHQQPEQD